MLILGRRPGESITIENAETGEKIVEILTLSIQGNLVRVGFAADEKYKIMRNEILDKPDFKHSHKLGDEQTTVAEEVIPGTLRMLTELVDGVPKITLSLPKK